MPGKRQRRSFGFRGVRIPARFVVVVLCLAGYLVLRLLNPLPWERLRDSSIGFLIEFSNNFPTKQIAPPPPTVVIVDIDDVTVNNYGKWPLPRSEITRLLNAVNRAHPAAIGCACVFLGESEGIDADFDRRLALSFHDGKVVLGVAEQRSTLAQASLNAAWTVDRPVVGFDNPNDIRDIPVFSNVTPVNNIFSEVAGGVGFLALQLSHDGIPRRLPTVVLYGKRLIPSLPVEMLRVGADEEAIGVKGGEFGVTSISIGAKKIPTDSNGAVWFRNHSDTPLLRLSAGDILAGRADLAEITGQYVLVGSTATGLSSDYVSADGSLLPGLDALAFSLNGLLRDATLSYPISSLLLEILIGLAAIAFAFATDRLFNAPVFLGLGATALVSLWAMALLYIRYANLIVDPGFVSLFLALVYGGLTLHKFLIDRKVSQNQISEKEHEVVELRQETAQAAMAAANPRLSVVLTHELRQPLAAAQNYLGAIRRLSKAENGEQSEKLAAYAEEATRQIKSMSEIMHEMADIVRGEFTVNQEKEIGSFIGTAVSDTVAAKGDGNVQIVSRIPETLPVVLANRRQIEQLVSNLTRNALEAPRQQDTLTLTVAIHILDAERIEVSIADNAAGIPEADQSKIFTRYVSSKPGGSGIGLALCRTIVEAHGGKLWFTSSTKPGASGTTFYFTLRRAS